MVLHRNPTNLGVAQSRRIGLNIARGKAIFLWKQVTAWSVKAF